MTYTRKIICPYDCPSSCGLLAETDGTRILKVKADPDHPVSSGLVCNKMQHYEESIHSEKRILTPLKRAGEKGEGRFVPVSWDEAVKEITDRWKMILKEDGADAILPVYFSGVMSVIQRRCGDAFFNRMGAVQVAKTLCSTAKGTGYAAVMGKTGCLDPRELKDSDFFLIWGSNVKATRVHTMPIIAKARKEGKRVVLVEACACDMADFCDEVLLVNPGTDGALALAMMHVLAEEQLADEDFLRDHAEGYEAFKATLPQYTPEWAEEITGVPASQIRQLAREYGAAKAPAILLGSGPSRHGNGGMTTRLIVILSAFTGAWGRPGGGYCGSNPGAGPYVDDARVMRPDFRQRPGREVNINQLGQVLSEGVQKEASGSDASGEPVDSASAGVVKSLYVYGSNPASSVSDQAKVLRGLRRPDLFTVVHERFMTETARFADIILPATFSVEQTDCYNAYGYCTFGTAKKVLEPAGACKSNWDTFCLLAKAMGYEEEYFQRTEEEMLADLLDHPMPALAKISEADWQTLREGGTISTPFADHLDIRTESGKMMIVNEKLAESMPRYIENHGGPESLRLIVVPGFYTLNSIFLERDSLTDKRGTAKLILHPQAAAARGIADGDRVIAYNDLAEVEFEARVSELVAPGTVAVQGIYHTVETCAGTCGSPVSFGPGPLTSNALHHERLSDMGAATTMNDNRVEVRRA